MTNYITIILLLTILLIYILIYYRNDIFNLNKDNIIKQRNRDNSTQSVNTDRFNAVVNKNMDNDPYDKAGFAYNYDNRYIKADTTIQFIKEEIRTIEQVLENKTSWLDVACGTGYHLHNVNSSVDKYGIDRSVEMIKIAESRESRLHLFREDLLSFNINRKFDLVSNFWYGYIHQSSVEEVKDFFLKMASLTKDGGDLLFGVCDPFNFMKNYRDKKCVWMDDIMSIDAVIWSAEIAGTDYQYKDCIAPHPQLFQKWLTPLFKNFKVIEYGEYKTMFLFTQKLIK